MEGEEESPAPENLKVTFEEFIQLMQQVENKLAKDDTNNQNRQEFSK
jgi:hypothetical protein